MTRFILYPTYVRVFLFLSISLSHIYTRMHTHFPYEKSRNQIIALILVDRDIRYNIALGRRGGEKKNRTFIYWIIIRCLALQDSSRRPRRADRLRRQLDSAPHCHRTRPQRVNTDCHSRVYRLDGRSRGTIGHGTHARGTFFHDRVSPSTRKRRITRRRFFKYPTGLPPKRQPPPKQRSTYRDWFVS